MTNLSLSSSDGKNMDKFASGRIPELLSMYMQLFSI